MTEAFVRRDWFRDRITWPAGPWDDEPDRVQWRDRPTGLTCLALRNWAGAWCGYVAVPPGHPWHGADYEAPDVDVHGGLTFAAPCMDDDRPAVERVCHVPAPGEPDDVWWLGFDCAHAWDLSPGIRVGTNDVYRTLGYVRGECTRLAGQVAEAKP